MKTIRSIATVKIIWLVFLLFPFLNTYSQEKKDLSINSKSSNSLGGVNEEGSLQVVIYDNANMQVFRYTSGVWLNQWYGMSSKSIWLYANGTSYCGNNAYFNGTCTKLNTISNINIDNNTNELIMEKSGEIRIKQLTHYPAGSDIIYYTYEVTNLSGNDLNDLRFFSGGDTYLDGGDNGSGFILPTMKTVGVKKISNNKLQRLYMEGVTTPYAYESRSYWAVYQSVISNALTNIIDDNESTDNGMALEYRTLSLSANETWTIHAIERFSSNPVTDIIVTAPLSGQIISGSYNDFTFTVKNRNTTPSSVTLLPSIDRPGWNVELLSPLSPLILEGNATENVIIRVNCPAGTTAGTNAKITLQAINSNGIASDICNIMVVELPSILLNPENISVCRGDSVKFSLSSSGAENYQWQEYSTEWIDLSEEGIYSGVNTAVLKISNTHDTMNNNIYRCKVWNNYGFTLSRGAILTINQPVLIINHTTELIACEGGNAAFEVDAKGSGITYQWQVKADSGFVNISDEGVYSGTNTNILTLVGIYNSMNEYEFRCLVTGICSNITTGNAVLKVIPSPSINMQPTSYKTCEGNSAVFMVNSESNNTQYSYQWLVNESKGFEYIKDNDTYKGSSTNALTIIKADHLMNDYEYKCEISNHCSSINSDIAKLIVHEIPVINLGKDTTVCENQTITLDAGPGINYIWSIPGLTGRLVTINAALLKSNSNDISVTVTNSYNCESNDVIEIIFTTCTNINEYDDAGLITIYPNPTNGMININFPTSINDADIQIFDMQGKMVKSEKVKDVLNTQLDLSNLSKGAYTVRIINNYQTDIRKLILN